MPGHAEFGGDRFDSVLGDAQVYPTVGGEVWADVALVVSLNFITIGSMPNESSHVQRFEASIFANCFEGNAISEDECTSVSIILRFFYLVNSWYDHGYISRTEARRGVVKILLLVVRRTYRASRPRTSCGHRVESSRLSAQLADR